MSHAERVKEMTAVLREKTDGELVAFGHHCARIGVEPGSAVADAIALELIRRGLVPGR